jgi:chemotaxis protein methyltransferase CheR
MGHPAELSGTTLASLIALVRKHTGITMSERKSILLQGRLRPRMRALSIASYDEYLALVERGGTEVFRFIDLVTTNDTLFFRTPQVWDYFAQYFMLQWHTAHPGQTMRIWSAAAASGEEAYSIAMLCAEFQAREPAFRYQILATDISQEILVRAREGQYGGRSVERIRQSHPRMFGKYMVPTDDGSAGGSGARVAEALKRHLTFAMHNLMKPLLNEAPFDIVFLRNVMIYFEDDVSEAILHQVSLSMKAGATLVLGESESIGRMKTAFTFVSPLVYRHDGAPA